MGYIHDAAEVHLSEHVLAPRQRGSDRPGTHGSRRGLSRLSRHPIAAGASGSTLAPSSGVAQGQTSDVLGQGASWKDCYRQNMTPAQAVVQLLTLCGIDAQIAHRVVHEELTHMTERELRAAAEALVVVSHAIGAASDSSIEEVDQALRGSSRK